MIAVNLDLLDWVKKELPRIPKCKFIGNFPDKISDQPVDRRRNNWIISLANLKKPKNHRSLVLAFSKVAKLNPALKLALIGTCEDEEYLRDLKILIQSENLEEKTTITGPVISLKKLV